MFERIVFFAVVTKIVCESCNPISTINLTVYRTIDSVIENVSVSGTIELKEDAFHLLLANESIPEFCENFVRITNELSVLQIINCSVTNIEPGAFLIDPTLTLLKISSNLLTSVKKGVFNNVRVKEIDLSKNLLSTIEDEAFDNNTYLEVLKLNYNAIKAISPDWFQNSPNVYKLSIIYNELTQLPPEAFKNLAKHRPLKLRLSANRISEISLDSFKFSGNIDILRLNGNKLVALPEEMFLNRTIKVLEVNTNRLLCFPDAIYNSHVASLQFLENPHFNCTCLRKVKEFVDKNGVEVMYPSIICEDRVKDVNLVFNFNKTYEIPLLLPSTGG
ncbi:hypothetical protein NQ318_004572 [Aromia moschata]|uniref:Uncharacterized protein n=1 Tax=Aromia moschata TaxID=1265417 RepID=A0AAV8Y944_9CUCU|nr:hypothetical protein NQ318_004572 [Aromia moschata]